MITVSQLGRRSSLAVLAVIVAVVVLLGVLVTRTSREQHHAALMNAAGRQRLLAERFVVAALARGDVAAEPGTSTVQDAARA